MNIYLVRHGESKGNVNKKIHLTTADHAIPLSKKGEEEAEAAGYFLKKHFQKHFQDRFCLSPSSYIRVWNSPYRRTRQTAKIIHEVMTETGSLQVDQREHLLLCEQQFGLFDGVPTRDLPVLYPNEYKHYQKQEQNNGKFWARMPLGESRFDVATRVHQSFGTFHRDYHQHGIDNIIVVCHGVTLRTFVMMWKHLAFEWVDQEANPPNCAIRCLKDGNDRGYIWVPDHR